MRLVRYTYPAFRTVPATFGCQVSPWRGLDTEIDRLFETARSNFEIPSASARFAVDLFEDKANAYVRAELPGLNREDISVEMADSTLTIAATRKSPAAAPAAGEAVPAHADEVVLFSRAVHIAQEVQAEKVSAAYENGVLTVTLPKREEVKPKKITVAVK